MAAVRCGAARTQGEATPTARVTDVDLYYDTHGAGPALVLIVGLDGDHALWRAFIPRLAERYQVLVFDHRSSGRGTGAARAFTIETLAEDTAGLLQALGLPRAGPRRLPGPAHRPALTLHHGSVLLLSLSCGLCDAATAVSYLLILQQSGVRLPP